MGFWTNLRNLFKKQDTVHEIIISDESRAAERQKIAEYLKQNITLTVCDDDSAALVRQGYRKISNVAGPIFNQLPGIVGANIAASAYKINLPEGFTINDLMRLKRNGELTTVLKKGGKGAFQGSASLVSTGPAAVVMGIFIALSVITSQYFLAEINKNLENIKQRISKIDFFLRLEKRCELLSNIDFLQEIHRDYEHIVMNPSHHQAVLNRIIEIKNSANRDCMFYTGLIESNWPQLNGSKDSQEQITETLSSIAENIDNLKCATMIYSISSIMELIFSDNAGNGEYIELIKADMEKHQRAFEGTLLKSISSYDTEKKHMEARMLLGGQIKRGKFIPDDFFNRQSVEEDQKVFCNDFIDSIDRMKALASGETEYAVCGDELYMSAKNSN